MGKRQTSYFHTDTEWEQNTHALLKQFLKYWQAQAELAKAILPRYHFLTLVLCNNCGLHCRRCFEAWPSGSFQIATKPSSPFLVPKPTISESILCAGHRLLQRTQRSLMQLLQWKRCFLSKYLTCTTCDKNKARQEKPLIRKLIPNTASIPWMYPTSPNTSTIPPEVYKAGFIHLHPVHPLGPTPSVFPATQLPLADSYISNQLCYWTISVKQ